MVSTDQKISYPLAGTCLKNWIPPNLNNAFHKPKETLESTSRKKGLELVPSQNNATF